jgi:ubiquinone biosynthesis protein Coq4
VCVLQHLATANTRFSQCPSRTLGLDIFTIKYIINLSDIIKMEHAVEQLVEALRYKPEGRRFDSRWC